MKKKKTKQTKYKFRKGLLKEELIVLEGGVDSTDSCCRMKRWRQRDIYIIEMKQLKMAPTSVPVHLPSKRGLTT